MPSKNAPTPFEIAQQMVAAWEAAFLPRAWWLPSTEDAPPAPAPASDTKPKPSTSPQPTATKPHAPKKRSRQAKPTQRTKPARPAKPKPRRADDGNGRAVSAKPTKRQPATSDIEAKLAQLEQSMELFGMPPPTGSPKRPKAVGKPSAKRRGAKRPR